MRNKHGSETDHHLLSEKKLKRTGVEYAATAKVMRSEQSKSSGCREETPMNENWTVWREQKERVNIIDVNGRYAWTDIWIVTTALYTGQSKNSISRAVAYQVLASIRTGGSVTNFVYHAHDDQP